MDEQYFGDDFPASLSNVTPTAESSLCYYFNLRLWMLYSLIPAVAILTLFCFLEQRVHLWPSFCHGRPGVAFPVNLVDSYTDRWSFAFAFGSMSTSMMRAILGSDNILLGEFKFETITLMLQGTVRFLVAMVNALIISVVFYPVLLCLRSKRALGNFLGLIYCIAWFTYYISSSVLHCDIDYSEGTVYSVMREIGTNGSGTICFLALIIRFVQGLVKDVKLQLKKNADTPQKDFTMTHYYQRVKYLLAPPPPIIQTGNIFVRLFQRFIGTVPGFRFSRHNICSLVLTVVTTIQVALVWMANKTVVNFFSNDPSAERAFWVTNTISIVVTLVFIIDMQLRYRKHTLKLWRGDRSFCPEEKAKFDAMMVSSLRYSGYQVAFTAWGFLILQVILFVISLLFIYGEEIVVEYLKKYWLTVLVTLGFYYAQMFVSRLVFLQRAPDQKQSRFLQSRETYLSLNNRRVFHVTMYITLFVNFLVGLLSCFFRILKAIVLETVFIGRLDRCTLIRDWEPWDQGFKSYIGFLELEVAHTHPVVITFCHFLLLDTNKRRWVNDESASLINAEIGFGEEDGDAKNMRNFQDLGETPMLLPSRQVRNKWLVALTLVRNPKLVFERKLALLATQRKKRVSTVSQSMAQTDVNFDFPVEMNV